MAADLIKAFEALSSEKEAVRKREENLVSDLTEVLGRLGYQLEPVGAKGSASRNGRTRGRGTGSSGSKTLTCSECGRTFALPLHLGRHMSVMHKAAKARRQAASAIAKGSTGAAQERKTTPRRRRMSPAARRAVSRRMKAYWRRRRAA
jgi:hypothetical protein